MKYLNEYRDPARVRALVDQLRAATRHPWTIMEVCGGQTHSVLRFGLDQLLPEGLRLIHGPGCPVCVTSVALIDHALQIAATPGVIFCSFGDMLRVPGSSADLRALRARGADVRVLTAPLDALALAEAHPDRPVVFFGVGFETTAPALAIALIEARRRRLSNFSALAAQVRVPPALLALAADPESEIQAFLAAGHVCAVMGLAEYPPLVERLGLPVVVTGFEPVDLLEGLLAAVRQLEAGRAEVENAYPRAVRPEGNPAAQAMIHQVFEPVDRAWRGLGIIPQSGLGFREAYADLDAARRFPYRGAPAVEHPDCQSGLVLTGRLRPPECPAFGSRCTPDTPLGAPMVSAEGACAAYHRYRGGVAGSDPR